MVNFELYFSPKTKSSVYRLSKSFKFQTENIWILFIIDT